MSKLTDRISYLQGLAEGMKLNPDKDSHRLIIEILDVLGEVGNSFEALAESHRELSEYVDAIDEDLAEMESEMLDNENEKLPYDGIEDSFDRRASQMEDFIEYECPHCGNICKIDPDKVDLNKVNLCPACKQDLFPQTADDLADLEEAERLDEEEDQ